MVSIRWSALALGAIVGAAVVTTGFAQDKLAEIKARQDFMKAQSADLKAVSEYAKGQVSQTVALAKANDLLARDADLLTQFPPGTSSAEFPGKTRARPELWANLNAVRSIVATLHDADVKLVAAVKTGNRSAVGPKLAAIGKGGCGPCHTKFRLPESALQH